MSKNRDAFFRAIERFNARDLEGYLEIYDENTTLHGYSEKPLTKAEITGFYANLLGALSDTTLDIEQLIEDEDTNTIAARFTLHGTHTGNLSGVPATGRPVAQVGMTFMRFKDGRIIERWSVADSLGVLVQIGAFPQPG
jgi:steroid delta-isomerase-like uncharacterized protein